MKAQFVYETLDFKRGRDPKSTMGIGLYKRKISPKSQEEVIEILYNLLPQILGTKEIPKDIFNKSKGWVFDRNYFNKIYHYIEEYIIFEKLDWVFSLRDKLLDRGYTKPDINENMRFERGVDPKRYLDIGRKRFWKKDLDSKSDDEIGAILYDLLPFILDTKEIPKDILNKQPFKGLNEKYFDLVLKYASNYIPSGHSWLYSLLKKLEAEGFTRIYKEF